MNLKINTIFFICLMYTLSINAQNDVKNNWNTADSLINIKEYKKAAIVLESIFRSRNYAGYGYDAARFRALAGDKKECFLLLSECIDKGFNKFDIIVNDSAFISLHKTNEWKQIKSRVTDSIAQWKKRLSNEFQQKYQAKIGVNYRSVEFYSNSVDSTYYIDVKFLDYKIALDTIYFEISSPSFEKNDCQINGGSIFSFPDSIELSLVGKTFCYDQGYGHFRIFFLDKNRYLSTMFDKDRHGPTYKKMSLWKVFYVQNIPFIVLFDENSENADEVTVHTYINAFLFPLSKEKHILFTNYQMNDTIILSPSNALSKVDKIVDKRIDVIKIKKNNKNGIATYLGMSILPVEYDSIYQGQLLAGIKKDKIILYDYDGNMIFDTLKAFYFYGQTKLNNLHTYQVIDRENKMYYINSLGEKLGQAPSIVGSMGNDSDISSYVGLTVLKVKRKLKITEKKYDCTIPKEPIYSQRPNPEYFYHQMPKKYDKIKFVNGEESIFHEDYWDDIGSIKMLNYNLMIVKKKNKYGIVRFPDLEEVIPFIYDNISCHKSYLILERSGLKTYYPYDMETKYKMLSDFTDYFARFRLPDGRMGWMDRSGKRFYD